MSGGPKRTADLVSPAIVSDLADRGTSAAPLVWVAQLRLSHFRSYAAAELRSDGRSVVLTGANGAGKTNLLEAVSMLGPGRGLRAARLGDLARRTAGGTHR